MQSVSLKMPLGVIVRGPSIKLRGFCIVFWGQGLQHLNLEGKSSTVCNSAFLNLADFRTYYCFHHPGVESVYLRTPARDGVSVVRRRRPCPLLRVRHGTPQQSRNAGAPGFKQND